MSCKFKVGDRVKVINDDDDLGYLGRIGTVHETYSKTKKVDIDFGEEYGVFWEHELQLIPMDLIKENYGGLGNIYDSAISASTHRDEVLFGEPELSHEEIWEAHLKYGKGEESETGSLRYNTGKPKMSLVTPEFILGMAQVLTKGAEKYGERNWELGNKTSVPYDSAMRHILAWRSGEDVDEESGCNHLFHAAVNLLMCWYYAENFSEMDDRR